MTVLTLKEAARYLKFKENKLRRDAQSGLIPCKRIGTGKCPPYRFVQEQLDKWLLEQPEFIDPRRV